ncbi:MAG: hypothetical protein E6J90_47955 [Deltaproteobacteria bacterium]|nr:MAG: hypothetical protein E6J90_47955 [Deltaproteobacteria bacterium]TMQ14822.1 MAG: hypothetical protein E6J91_14555 [Deltaproteobacteria bacterium]
MTATARRTRRLHAPRRARPTADATREPDPGPAPEAVFERVTGPHPRRIAQAWPGHRICDEDM